MMPGVRGWTHRWGREVECMCWLGFPENDQTVVRYCARCRNVTGVSTAVQSAVRPLLNATRFGVRRSQGMT
jgi:hypothetical protein